MMLEGRNGGDGKEKKYGKDQKREGANKGNKVDTKFLTKTLLKGKVIQRHDIPSLLTAIFEVSVTKHTELGLLPSNSSSNGGGGGGGQQPNESYQISPDILILSSE